MSKRAAEAREEGRFPKTDFKKVYNMPQATLDALVKVGVIDGSEWHHTSKVGNKTHFFGWVNEEFADVYAENKKGVDGLVKEVQEKVDALQKEEKDFLSTWKSYEYPDTFDWKALQIRSRELEDEDYNTRMDILHSEFPELKEAEEHNSVQQKFSRRIGNAIREESNRLLSFFESEVAAQAERVDAEITEAVNTLSAELNTPVEIVAVVTDIPNARKRASKGWYENGKVYLVLPNAEGVEDAVETVLHEVVGHYGLRRLFGDKFNDMLDDVLLNASKKVRMAIIERAMPLMTQGRGDALRVATEAKIIVLH